MRKGVIINKPLIELVPAFVWTCDNCGRDNFERAIVCELSPEERQEINEANGIEDGEMGDWMLAPEEVKCPHCDAGYTTRHFRDM